MQAGQEKILGQARSPREYVAAGAEEINYSDEEWKTFFRKEKFRTTFVWWGEHSKIPEQFPYSQTLQIKQVSLGGKHFLALTGKISSQKEKRINFQNNLYFFY